MVFSKMAALTRLWLGQFIQSLSLVAVAVEDPGDNLILKLRVLLCDFLPLLNQLQGLGNSGLMFCCAPGGPIPLKI